MQESIVETLKNMKSEQNLTLQQISSASGVPLSTVNRILSGQTENPSFRDVAAIVAAMDGSLDAITGLQKLESENGQLLDSNVMQLLLSMQNYYAKTLDATRQQYMRELENKDKQYRDILTDKNRWLSSRFCSSLILSTPPLAFSIPEPFGGLPFARRRSSLSISHLSLFYFSAPAVYLLSPSVPFFILFLLRDALTKALIFSYNKKVVAQ